MVLTVKTIAVPFPFPRRVKDAKTRKGVGSLFLDGIAGLSAKVRMPRRPCLASPLTAHPVRVEVRRNSGKRKGVEGRELFKGGTGT